MREIKFRAWKTFEESGKKISYMDYEPRASQGRYVSEESYENGNTHEALVVKLNDFFKNNSKDCILMQYTGLKDKNCKDIYEGDVVSVYTPNKGGDVNRYRKVVRWNVSLLRNGWNIGQNKNHLVIGNIYENPELLK